MIQRKQSLFLLGSTCISVLLLYLPLYELASETGVAGAGQMKISVSAILLILNGAIGVLSFATIFLFKTRNIQVRLCNLALLLTCVFLGLIFFMADSMSSGINQKVRYLYGTYLPIIQILFIFLAGMFIRQDEKLVRSADRLR